MGKQRKMNGGSERDEHHRKYNKEAEKVRERRDSEKVKDCCFARQRLRAQMRRRYFMRFPVGVWPPGAAPTSACLGGYKLTAEPGRRCC